ncbi:MAG: AraC family transcriptional regulator, partial [Eubacteriales bacterium]
LFSTRYYDCHTHLAQVNEVTIYKKARKINDLGLDNIGRRAMLLTYGYETVSKSWNVSQSATNIYMRLYLIESGEVVCTYKGVSCVLKPGFLYAFPTTESYTITHNPNHPLCCVYLHIAIAPYSLSHLIEIDMHNEEILSHLLSAFTGICKHRKNEIYGTLQQELSHCIFTCLIQKNIFHHIDERLAKSVNYLLQHMDENIPIEELAQISGYHPKYYNKLFSKQMGVTPHQFVVQYRMKQALSLLQDGNSIVSTALAIGYLDEKSFSRMFKKTYGILPKQVNKTYFSI